MTTAERKWTLQRLADFTSRLTLEDIPVTTRTMVKHCLLDLSGAAVAGAETKGASALRRLALAHFAGDEAGVWFADERRCSPAAALANCAAAAALDLDDGHRLAGGHPGASIIPAVLAVAQEVGAEGAAVIVATVIGYEVAVRVAAARDFSRLDTLSSGRWCAYGAAAAAAWLQGLPPEAAAEAMAIAGVQSPGLSASGYSRVMGNHVKEGIPWATMTGLSAVALARGGFTGPTDILDHPHYYDRQKIIADLGHGFAIDRVYFKPYACCRWIHGALEALQSLMAENGLSAADITTVRVDTFERALRLNNYPDPATLEAAQYSLPFCLGVMATEGPAALLPMKAASLRRSETVDFARRVALAVDPVLDRRFPEKTPARVVAAAGGETYEKLVTDPLGDPANPMTFGQLTAKFNQLTQDRLAAGRREQLLTELDRLEEKGPQPLLDILQAN